MMKRKKNILVTAVGGRSVGSGILHALTRANPGVSARWNVVASDANSFSWGLYKVDQSCLLPLAKADNYCKEVNRIVKEYKIDAIIPGSEIEAEVLTKNQSRFMIPIIANQNYLMPLMMDKFETTKKLEELGLPVIPQYSIKDWKIAVEKSGFPLILKPTEGTGGSKGVFLCVDATELSTALEKVLDPTKYCIQKYVGTAEEEFTVGVLSDKRGVVLDSIVMQRKLIGLSLLESKKIGKKSISTSTGYSQGFFIKHKKIQMFCESLATKLGSVGPLNVQLRLHKGVIYVFEIHPRFSGTSTMRADVGFNEPDVLLRNYLSNEQFGRLNYQYDVAVIRALEHVVIPIKDML